MKFTMESFFSIKLFSLAMWSMASQPYQPLVLAERSSEFYLIGTGVKWPSPLAVSSADNRFKCLSLCQVDDACASVNYENTSGTCEQNGFPTGLTPEVPDTAPGWVIISRLMAYPMNMTGSVAWHHSTNNGFHASKAIDGGISTHIYEGSCSETSVGYSFWAVEFPTARHFSGVSVYYRTDCCISRTAKLTFLVSMSRKDSNAGISTEVGYYEGPPNGEGDNPLLVPFTSRSYGKVLRIKHGLNTLLQLCEVTLRVP